MNYPSKEKFAQLPLQKRLIALQRPMNFLRYCVFTRDEVDATAPIKPAPVWPDLPGYKPYIKPIVEVWENSMYNIIDKSRRMWISYLMLALHLHLAITRTDRRIGIVSKKFEDACAHLENIKIIYENIPDSIWPSDVRPALRAKEGFLHFDEIGSVIHALASGPDQARQYGFSALFFDEFDFWEAQQETYAAAAPTLQGGGRLSIATTHQMVTSGEESFYRKLKEDRVG